MNKNTIIKVITIFIALENQYFLLSMEEEPAPESSKPIREEKRRDQEEKKVRPTRRLTFPHYRESNKRKGRDVPIDPSLFGPKNRKQEKKEMQIQKSEKELTFPKAYFNETIKHIKSVIMNLIENEYKSIIGCMYRFTLYDLAKVWIARKEFLDLKETTLLVDSGYQKDSCAALRLLIENNFSVLCNTERWTGNTTKEGKLLENMHHKFLIFSKNGYKGLKEKSILVTGSFNCTGMASQQNSENIVLIDDQECIEDFKKEAKYLIRYSKRIKIDDCKCTSETEKTPKSRKLNRIPDSVED